MSDKRIRFFCARSKVDEQTQTPTHRNIVKDKRNTVDKLKKFEADHLLSGDILPKSSVDSVRCRDVNNRFPFYLATCRNKRFDAFTPPPDLFSSVSIALIFTFYESNFVISTAESSKSVGFSYEPWLYPVLETLETGIMSKEFVNFMEKFHRMQRVDNGCIFVKVIDCRVVPEMSFTLPVKVGDDVMRHYISQERSQLSPLERESKYVAARNPVICTDPSLSVARVESVVDFREKMWVPHRTGHEEIPKKKHEVKPPPTGMRFEYMRTTDVSIPTSTQEKCAHFLRHSTEQPHPIPPVPPVPQMHG